MNEIYSEFPILQYNLLQTQQINNAYSILHPAMIALLSHLQ